MIFHSDDFIDAQNERALDSLDRLAEAGPEEVYRARECSVIGCEDDATVGGECDAHADLIENGRPF